MYIAFRNEVKYFFEVYGFGDEQKARWRRSGFKIGGIGRGVLHAEIASLRKARTGERFLVLAAIHHGDVEATCGMAGVACFFEVFDRLAGVGRDSLSGTIAFGQTAAAAPPSA